MKYRPLGSVSKPIELSETSASTKSRPGAVVSLLTPLDPLRQAKRLPIRVIKMLTAHTGHLLHPEYLQPLTPAPVSIEVFLCLLKTHLSFREDSSLALQSGENVLHRHPL